MTWAPERKRKRGEIYQTRETVFHWDPGGGGGGGDNQTLRGESKVGRSAEHF